MGKAAFVRRFTKDERLGKTADERKKQTVIVYKRATIIADKQPFTNNATHECVRRACDQVLAGKMKARLHAWEHTDAGNCHIWAACAVFRKFSGWIIIPAPAQVPFQRATQSHSASLEDNDAQR